MLRTVNSMLGLVARARPSRSMSSRPGLGSRDAEGGAMHVATPYLLLPGASGDYASTPDAAALDITGDIELVVLAALDDWTPAASNELISKYISSGNQRSWRFYVNSTGNLHFNFSYGDGATVRNSNSTVAPTVSNDAFLWVKVTYDVNDGAGNRVVKYYTAAYAGSTTEPSSWTQLGSTVTTAGTNPMYAGTAPVEIGSINGGGTNLAGKIARAIIRDGIDGTTVFDFDPSIATVHGQTSIVEQSGNNAVVTVNGGAVLYAA